MANFRTKAKDYQLKVTVKLSMNEKLDEISLDDYTRKYVRGLLKAKKISKKKIEYLGPIGISLLDRLKKEISKYDFFFIMEQIVDLCRKMENAQLDINSIVLNPKSIYINEQTKEIQFIYLPLQGRQKVNLLELMYNIIYAIKPRGEYDNSFISQFAYFLRGMNTFETENIEKYIMKEERKVVYIIKKHNIGQSGFMTDKPRDYYEHYEKKEEDELTGLLEDEEATGLLEDGEEATGLLEDEEATGLLNENYEVKYATLYRALTDETIVINKPVFRLGKEKNYCDYFVYNNNAVSRSHADIITRGQQFFIMDLNSTNKTYLNGTQITPRQEVELFEGDNIRLANEEFVFHT